MIKEEKAIKEKKTKKDGVRLGDIGTIWLPEIRHNHFFVMLDDAEDKVKRKTKLPMIMTHRKHINR
ncbi:MAG: hypothetical protein IKQ31_00560 [Clostridia bacterium]|nr:hypothetical protein [Clostridia bacterium]